MLISIVGMHRKQRGWVVVVMARLARQNFVGTLVCGPEFCEEAYRDGGVALLTSCCIGAVNCIDMCSDNGDIFAALLHFTLHRSRR